MGEKRPKLVWDNFAKKGVGAKGNLSDSRLFYFCGMRKNFRRFTHLEIV